MAEMKQHSRSETRYGSKDKPNEGSANEEREEPKKEAMAEGDDMAKRHKGERKDMRSRHESEHRDIHGQHRTAMRDMHSRHEADMKAMNDRQESEMGAGVPAGGGATGTPDAGGDQLPQAGMSPGSGG